MTIPVELTTIPQWVAWSWLERRKPGGAIERTKVPINPKTLRNASSTNRETWGTLMEAQSANKSGIGFVVTLDDPYCGVDIDHCYDATKDVGERLDKQARAIVERLGSYTELTVSGGGIRVWVKGVLTREGRKKHLENGVSVEFYDRARYFTVTGQKVGDTPRDIQSRQVELDALHRELFPDPPPQASPTRGRGLSLSDFDLLARAKAARNGDKFERLWNGDISDHADDDSAADMSLMCHLAFWTGKDPAQMERLFRQSALAQREKWDREDYRIRTINAALVRTRDVWTPGLPRERGAEFTPPPEPVTVEQGQDISGLIEIPDISASIDEYYDGGAKPGEHPGWESLAPLYRIQRGEWTVVTGAANSGKSTWMDALALNLIDNLGWRFAMFSPETQPIERHFSLLAEKLLGEPFSGPAKMDREQMLFAKEFLANYVTFVFPESPTIDALLDCFKRVIDRRGLDGAIIDPYNEIEHSRPSGTPEHEYLSWVLTKIRRFVRQHGIHLWLVAHPKKLDFEFLRDEKGKVVVREGKQVRVLPVPELDDISGGYAWKSKSDNGIVIYRDPEADVDAVEVHVKKIRDQRLNGKPGVAHLRWIFASGRFEDTGICLPSGFDREADSPPAERPRYADPPLEEPVESAGQFSDRRSVEATTDSAESQQGDIWGPIGGELSDDAIRAAMSPNYGED